MIRNEEIQKEAAPLQTSKYRLLQRCGSIFLWAHLEDFALKQYLHYRLTSICQ